MFSLAVKTIKGNMDKNILKEIIIEQQNNLEKNAISIPREILVELKKELMLPHAKIISGIRRVGKSTAMRQIMNLYFENKCYYFSFEDERLVDFESRDFNQLLEAMIELYGKKSVFFFDEIQNVTGWENFVRRLQDRNYNFFITGSNASLLSKELGTKLTGRYVAKELFPFSFKEYLLFKNYNLDKNYLYDTQKRVTVKKLFNQYLLEGGMPEYLKYRNDEVLKGVYDDIIYRDIASRYEIKEIKALRELALYYFSNIANLASYNKLKEYLKLGSVNTVKNYTQYLENSYLVFTVNIFSYSLPRQYIAPKKIYVIDNGLAKKVSFSFSRDTGKLLENLVFLQLKRQRQEIFYYKTKDDLEVDFVLRRDGKIAEIIQVADNLSNLPTRSREIKSIQEAMNELNIKRGIILTMDESDEVKLQGKTITIMPVYQWLLS